MIGRTANGERVVKALLAVLIVAWIGVSGPGHGQGAEPEHATPAATAPTVWSQWRGPGRDGLSPEVPAQMPEKKLLWQQLLESDAPAGVAVANGFVVVACHVGAEDQVRCYSADKGDLRWTYASKNTAKLDNGNGPRATPLICEGRIYTVSAIGECCCLDLAMGTVLWKLDLPKEFNGRSSSWGYCSSPLIVDGKLIVSPLGQGVGIAALDPLTGKALWQTRGVGQPHSSFIAGAFGGVLQIVGYDGKELAGWDVRERQENLGPPAAKGERLQRRHAGERGRQAPGRHGEQWCATLCVRARRQDRSATGGVEPDLTPDIATPVYHNGFVFGSGPDFMCLDAKTLKTRWKESAEEAVTSFTMVVAGNQRLLVVNGDGEMALLTAQAEKFELLGKTKICGKTQSHPALTAGRLFIRDGKALYCYGLK